MGLEKGNMSDVIYLKVTDGKIRLTSDKKDPEAVKRVVEIKKEKYTMYERIFTALTGRIIELDFREEDKFADKLNVHVLCKDKKKEFIYCLQLSEKNRYYQTFVERLPNVDFTKEVSIGAYLYKAKTEDGYDNYGVTIRQEDEKVPSYYSTWTKKKGTKYKNGREAFDFTSLKKKKDKEIMKINLLAFLRDELEKQLKRFKKYLKKNPTEVSEKKDKKKKKKSKK